MYYQLPGLPQLPNKLIAGHGARPAYGAANSYRYSRCLEGSRFRNFFMELQQRDFLADLHAGCKDDTAVDEATTSNSTSDSGVGEFVSAVSRPAPTDDGTIAKVASTVRTSASSWEDWKKEVERETGTSVSTSPKEDDDEEDADSSSSDEDDNEDSDAGLTPEERHAKLVRSVIELCESFLNIFDDLEGQQQSENAAVVSTPQQSSMVDVATPFVTAAGDVAPSYTSAAEQKEASQRESDARYAHHVMSLVQGNQKYAAPTTDEFAVGLAAVESVDDKWAWGRVANYVEDMCNR